MWRGQPVPDRCTGHDPTGPAADQVQRNRTDGPGGQHRHPGTRPDALIVQDPGQPRCGAPDAGVAAPLAARHDRIGAVVAFEWLQNLEDIVLPQRRGSRRHRPSSPLSSYGSWSAGELTATLPNGFI